MIIIIFLIWYYFPYHYTCSFISIQNSFFHPKNDFCVFFLLAIVFFIFFLFFCTYINFLVCFRSIFFLFHPFTHLINPYQLFFFCFSSLKTISWRHVLNSFSRVLLLVHNMTLTGQNELSHTSLICVVAGKAKLWMCLLHFL